MESIQDSRGYVEDPRGSSKGVYTDCYSPGIADSGSSSLLDIYRETWAPPVSPPPITAKLTEKRSPDLTFSPEEKALFRAKKLQETEQRSKAALAIARDYVNTAQNDEERSSRLDLFGSLLKCHRRAPGPVDLIQYDGGGLSVAGVWRCRSKWICPDCSSRLMYSEAIRLKNLLESIIANNVRRGKLQEEQEQKIGPADASRLVVLFITLTAPHCPGDDLREQMELFSRCFTSTLHSTSIKKQRDKLGFCGYIRCFDHTVKITESGLDWHSHFHVLMVLDTDKITGEGSSAFAAFSDKLYSAWAYRVAAAYDGTRETSKNAFCAEFVKLDGDGNHSSSALADYAAKVCALPGYLTKSAKDKIKDGEHIGGLTPWDLLDLYHETGSPVFADAWISYCEGTKGFHRIEFSNGLEDRFGKQKENSENARRARFVLPADVAEIALGSPMVLDGIKAGIRSQDVEALSDLLAGYGLEQFAPEIVSPLPLPEKPRTEAELAGERIKQTLARAKEAEDDERAARARSKEAELMRFYKRIKFPEFEWTLSEEELGEKLGELQGGKQGGKQGDEIPGGFGEISGEFGEIPGEFGEISGEFGGIPGFDGWLEEIARGFEKGGLEDGENISC